MPIEFLLLFEVLPVLTIITEERVAKNLCLNLWENITFDFLKISAFLALLSQSSLIRDTYYSRTLRNGRYKISHCPFSLQDQI